MQRLHPLRAKTRPTQRVRAGHMGREYILVDTPNTYAQCHAFSIKGLDMSQAHFYSNPTSVYWTCKALMDGQTISQLTQIQNVKGWRLPAVIHRLKAEYHWPICTEYRQPDGVAFYSLPPDVDRATLRFPKSAVALGNGEDCA